MTRPTNAQVAKAWIDGAAYSTDIRNRSMCASSGFLYSYATPIARRYGPERVALITCQDWSHTTKCHKSQARRAAIAAGYTVYEVPYAPSYDTQPDPKSYHRANVQYLSEQAENCRQRARSARLYADGWYKRAIQYAEQAIKYNETFLLLETV